MSFFESLRLDGQIALVTGAGRGIGATIARYLAEAGAEVVLLSRTLSELQTVAQQIAEAGGRSSIRQCDVIDSKALRAIIDELPRLDILVNNAGTNIPEPMIEVSDEHLDHLLNLNIRSCFIAAQAAVKKMLQDPDRVKKGGSVIHISSQMGHIGSPNRTVYCATKHAIEGLTKAMAIELAEQNIRVNSVAPTFVDTPLVRQVVNTDEKRAFLFSKIPLGHLAETEDIAAAVAYLASPAARMVTGTCLKVDGGWTAQ
ncbi:FabG Dehydrogenases with different specificities (related to short-chain alcohol dehydrogenases) [Burkholderiaceae bacterium]|jgi:NAD(P)-dependent dehydrogenase (short-subunit alcohol dehydrogenase family)